MENSFELKMFQTVLIDGVEHVVTKIEKDNSGFLPTVSHTFEVKSDWIARKTAQPEGTSQTPALS